MIWKNKYKSAYSCLTECPTQAGNHGIYAALSDQSDAIALDPLLTVPQAYVLWIDRLNFFYGRLCFTWLYTVIWMSIEWVRVKGALGESPIVFPPSQYGGQLTFNSRAWPLLGIAEMLPT